MRLESVEGSPWALGPQKSRRQFTTSEERIRIDRTMTIVWLDFGELSNHDKPRRNFGWVFPDFREEYSLSLKRSLEVVERNKGRAVERNREYVHWNKGRRVEAGGHSLSRVWVDWINSHYGSRVWNLAIAYCPYVAVWIVDGVGRGICRICVL